MLFVAACKAVGIVAESQLFQYRIRWELINKVSAEFLICLLESSLLSEATYKEKIMTGEIKIQNTNKLT